VRPNEADLANYRAMLATAARRFFGATEGTVLRSRSRITSHLRAWDHDRGVNV
jgi:hypothetical protein